MFFGCCILAIYTVKCIVCADYNNFWLVLICFQVTPLGLPYPMLISFAIQDMLLTGIIFFFV